MANKLTDRLLKIIQTDEKPIKLDAGCLVLSPVNRKGGAGKTVSAINISTCLAEMGYRVLLIDLDDSADSTQFLGGKELGYQRSIGDVFLGECTIDQAIQEASVLNTEGVLWFLAGGLANEHYAEKFGNDPKYKLRLRLELEKIKPRFDFIMLDCPPKTGFWPASAILAADFVFTPITGPQELSGYTDTFLLVRECQKLNPKVKHIGVYFTRVNRQTLIYRDLKATLSAQRGLLFETEIPTDTKVEQAFSLKVPLTTYAPSSKGAVAYRSLTREVLQRCQQQLQKASHQA